MPIITHKEENYIKFECIDAFNAKDLSELEKQAANFNQYWIIGCFSDNISADDGLLNDLSALNKVCTDGDGLLVICGGNKQLESAADEMELTWVPSYDEAVDYVFIEQLERGFDDFE